MEKTYLQDSNITAGFFDTCSLGHAPYKSFRVISCITCGGKKESI
jgi:hypothetical protein